MKRKRPAIDAVASPTPPDATLVSKGNERVFGNACIGLVRTAWGLSTIQRFARPSQGVIEMHDGDRGATPNQRGLARVWDFGSAPDDEIEGPAARLIDFFVKQRTTEGHQYAEFNSPSHGQLWPIIGSSARALALHRKHERLIEVTGEWWCCEADLCDKLLDPDGHRTGPCGRAAGTTFDIGTVLAHFLRGTAPPEYSLIPNAKGEPRLLISPPRAAHPGFWLDSYNIGIWMAARLKERGDDLGGALTGKRIPVRARDPVRILRCGEESVKVVDFARSSEFCFWCAQLNEKPNVECRKTSPGRYEAPHRKGRFPEGLANPFPAPDLPGATITVIPGVP